MAGIRYVCARCRCPVRSWIFFWTHSDGGGARKTCGLKPIPLPLP